MKSTFLATLAVTAFLIPAQSYAQSSYGVSVGQYERRDGDHDQNRHDEHRDERHDDQHSGNTVDHGNGGRYDPRYSQGTYNVGSSLEGRYEHRRDDRRDRAYGSRYDRSGSQYRGHDRDNRWNPGWRNDQRYDWQSNRNRYGNNYRQGRYYGSQYGGGYGRNGRISIGVTIGSPYYSSRYQVNNPSYYRLPPAYAPYRWVRYNDDVLLVDTRNGYVADIINNFFW